ncbi:MAG: transporter substrate-binding domain-containing protein [Clostridiales bacterium]|nr:transporter substrate-binding domain-containing protein [Clostridiales bacterium]
MKKNIKRIIALVAVAAMVLSLAACGSSSSSSSDASDTGSADAEASGTSSDSDVLIMATNAAFPPYEYYEGEDIVGIDVEIAQAIADSLGMTLQVEDMDFSSILVAVQSGKADMGVAGMTVTDERLENVNFSDSYATGVQVIIVPEDSDITGPDDLEGKKIGVQESTTGHIYCEDEFGTSNVTPYTTGAGAVEALKNGKVDCVVIDNEPAKAYVEANEGLKILDTEYVTEDYAIAIAKENTELLDEVNECIESMKDDGSLQAILDKYINADD